MDGGFHIQSRDGRQDRPRRVAEESEVRGIGHHHCGKCEGRIKETESSHRAKGRKGEGDADQVNTMGYAIMAFPLVE